MSHRQHGTRAKYVVDKCRCDDCTEASRVAEAHRRRQRAYGIQSYVDAEPARQHVRNLGALGMGWKRVARAAGLSPSTVWKLVYGDRTRFDGPSKRVRPATANAILAVELDLADGAIIDCTGTTRRIQALVALGYSQSFLAGRLDIGVGNFGPLSHGTRDVTVATARDVRALFDELGMTPPTARDRHHQASVTRSRRYAQIAGWVPPLAWDDDTIDDPDAKPNVGEARKRDLLEDFDWLIEQGESRDSACQILGVQPATIDTARKRAAARGEAA